MGKIIQIIKNHKWAIILAFIAAVIIAYPQIYLRYELKDNYRGIEILGTEDEGAWLSRVREAIDGHFPLGNPYFREGKNDPYTVQPLGSMMVAGLGRLFSLDINNTLLLSRLVFSFIVFLLIYCFALFFAKKRLIALPVSVFLMLGNALFGRYALLRILSGESSVTRYINYTRPVNPLMTSFFFFGFLLFFWLFFERKQWRWGILSAIFLGLSFYDYFYTWTFLYAFLGVLVTILFFQKNWRMLKKIILMLFGATILALPAFFNLYQIAISPTYADVAQRLGVLATRSPVLGFLVPGLFVLFLLFFPRKLRNQYYFGLALVITPFIVLNQQIVTSKAMQSAHYHWYYHLPLAAFFLWIIFFYWVSKINWQMLQKALAVLIVIASIAAGIFFQKSSYAFNKEMIIQNQRYGEVMDWLDENAGKDEVVLSDTETPWFIVIYTPLNAFYHYSGKFTLAATKERMIDILFTYYRLAGLYGNDAGSAFLKDRRFLSSMIYGIYYREAAGDEGMIPDELVLALAQKYQESFDSISTDNFIKQIMDKYGIKYIVWDKRNFPLWQLEKYDFLKNAAKINDFEIFQRI